MRAALEPARGLAAVVLAAAAVAGCEVPPEVVGDNEVFLYLPATRLELPEASQKWFGIGFGAGTGDAYRLSGNQLNEEPRLESADTESYGQTAGRLELQPHRRVGAALHVTGSESGGGDEGIRAAQLKWNVVYPERADARFSTSITAAYGESRQQFTVHYTCGTDNSCTPQSAHTDVDRTLRDAAVIFGYESSRWWMIYGGPFYRSIDFVVAHEADRGTEPDVRSGFEGRAHVAGVNLGGALRLYNWSRVLLEVSVANIDLGERRDTFVHAGIGQQFHFGPKFAPPALEERR